MTRHSIAILTATLNAAEHLPGLIDSLKAQVDKDFRWVVMDGGSTDGTLEMLAGNHGLSIQLVSQPDNGIYDAFNKALPLIHEDYYMVLGADDRLAPAAISQYRAKADETHTDLVIAAIDCGGTIRYPGKVYRKIPGIWSIITNHSVGTLIRTGLHRELGEYNNYFSMAGDIDFLCRVHNAGATYSATSDVVGFFSTEGVSSKRYLRGIFESAMARIENGAPLAIELVIMLLRIIKHYSRIRYALGKTDSIAPRPEKKDYTPTLADSSIRQQQQR
jgi:glycosyltransferase involved in cell wall biosynthesis